MASMIIACPRCGGRVNRALRTCPLCGCAIFAAIEKPDINCPRCRCGLAPYPLRDTTLHRCPRCTGLWLGRREFERLTTEKDVYADALVPPEFERKPLPPPEGYLPCPCCGKRMNRVNFRGISGVMIDVCRDCGSWLDAGELEQVRAFIASGGVDRTQDRLIERNRLAIGSLEGRVDDLEFMEKVLHRWKFLRGVFRGW